MEYVKVRLDLIDPHEYLNYLLKYKQFIELIKSLGGYVAGEHIIKINKEMYNETERQTRYLLSALTINNWLGQIALGKHKMYYLKKKANVCLSNNPNISDLRLPSTRKIINTLLAHSYLSKEKVLLENIPDSLFWVFNHNGRIELVYSVANKTINLKNLYAQLLEVEEQLERSGYLISKIIFLNPTFTAYQKFKKDFLETTNDLYNHLIIRHEGNFAVEDVDLYRFFDNNEPF